MERVLTIQDISCVGQCSITVALPILSVCGLETAILPTAVLSNHTGGFQGYTFRDMTPELPAIASQWQREGITFDAVYTGYLGRPGHIPIVKTIMEGALVKGGLRIVDPAMADHGKLYQGLEPDYVEAMKELVKGADILLPNMTEAALLTGREPVLENQSPEDIESLLKGLEELGAGGIILKGICQGESLGMALRENGKTDFVFTPRLSQNKHGTGDCFAAAFTGLFLQGGILRQAVEQAADFVRDAMVRTEGDQSHWYGVKFEKSLGMLLQGRDCPVPKP